jgi:hypothetical protein
MKVVRFLYINIYTFLLFGLAVFVYFIPMDIFLYILKILCVFFLALGGLSILGQWNAKNKKIKILAARNKNGIRPDTFKKVRSTFCGQLMVNLTLRDLRKTENYSSLSKAEWKEQKRRAKGAKAKKPRNRKKNIVDVSAK